MFCACQNPLETDWPLKRVPASARNASRRAPERPREKCRRKCNVTQFISQPRRRSNGGFAGGAAELLYPDSIVTVSVMSSVVFFRAVNVGGHQSFQPGKVAKDLAHLGVVNIGAAGTFVVREKVRPEELRDEILRRLPFKPELMICPGPDVLALVRGSWFGDAPVAPGIGRFVSVLEKAPRSKPPLPLEQPAGKKWEVRIVAVTGRFVLSVR